MKEKLEIKKIFTKDNFEVGTLITFFLLSVMALTPNVNADEINLYTTRHYDSDIKLYKDFTKQTGINVNIISGKAKPLEKRILEEGKSCKGDLFFLADAGRLFSAQKNGVFKKVISQPYGMIVVSGPTGSGKSTILKILAGLILPTEGKLKIFGEEQTYLRLDQNNPPDVRLVFQNPALLGSLTIEENVGFILQRNRTLSKKFIQETVRECSNAG